MAEYLILAGMSGAGPLDRGRHLRGPRLVRDRQPAARPHRQDRRAHRPGRRRVRARLPRLGPRRLRGHRASSRRRSASCARRARECACCSSTPPTRFSCAATRAHAGAIPSRPRACSPPSEQEREMLDGATRRGRRRGRHRRAERARAARPPDRARRRCRRRRRDADRGRLLRLQARHPARRRPRLRLPFPAQPALGAGAARPERARCPGARLRARQRRRPRSCWNVSTTCSPSCCPPMPARASPISRSPSAARAGGTARSCSRRRSPNGSGAAGYSPSCTTGTSTDEQRPACRHGEGGRDRRWPRARPDAWLRPAATPREITAVVSVADDGGSSGRLRELLGIPAPGDLRRCIGALLPEASPLAEALEHRFSRWRARRPRLRQPAHRRPGARHRRLRVRRGGGRPVCSAPSAECCRRRGSRSCSRRRPACGELIGQAPHNQERRDRDRLARTARRRRPPEAVLEAIGEADQIVLGPGSLFTSVLAACVVPEIRERPRRGAGPARLCGQPARTTARDRRARRRRARRLACGPTRSPSTSSSRTDAALPLGRVADDVRLVVANVAAEGFREHDPELLGAELSRLLVVLRRFAELSPLRQSVRSGL